jgi:hypothetical protein
MGSRSARRVAGAVVFAAAFFALTLRTSRLGWLEFCGPLPDICDAARDADIVFLGEVLGTNLRPRTPAGNVAEDAVNEVRFKVLRVFRGDEPDAGGEWSGEFHERQLAHRFVGGQRVVVYARRSYRRLLETTCGRTRAYNPDDAALSAELSQLGACRLPE